MQAVVVVGDVDVNQIEQKIKSIFSDIPAPVDPKQKVIHKIPDNAEPIVAVITDPEATSSSIEVLWKSEPMPLAYNNTDVGFMTDIIKGYISLIMRERFGDISAKPDAPFIGASFGVGRLCLASDAAFGNVSFKDGTAATAFQAYMTEIEKMKRFGFTDGEVQRAKDNLISSFEKAAEAASTRKNADFVRPLLNNFYFNESYMDPATELQLAQMVCAQITAPILGQVAASLITDENMVILFNGPEKEGLVNPTEAQLAETVAAVKTAEIAANVEENINEPLIDESALKGSKVKKETTGLYGSTVWTLKNGVKVVVLPTQHKKDQILYNLNMDGGKSVIPTEAMPSFEDNIWSLYLSNTGLSKFSGTQLPKMLAGKNVSVTPYLGNSQHGINGQCAPKDIETAMQLMYLTFVEPRFDQDEYATGIQQIKAVLPNLKNNPMFLFQNAVNKIMYGGNERVVELNEETLAAADLETIKKVYTETLFNDAAGATLTIVGNVDLDALKPMVEKYIGSLPKGKKAHKYVKENLIGIAKGNIDNTVKIAMQTPKSTVFQVHSAYMPVDTKTEVSLEIAKYVLDMIYTKTIREQEGGTYGVGTGLSSAREPFSRVTVLVQFDTNPEQAERLGTLTTKYLKEFAQNGPTAEEFAMAVENVKKNLPESRISNNYWLSALSENEDYGIDYDAEYEKALNTVTAEDVKTLLQAVLAQENFIQIMMVPAE
jgi:zinc protease